MLRRLESQRLGEVALDMADRAARHVLDFAALRAHRMMMMLGRAEKIRALASPPRADRRSANRFERFERPVDRREPDAAALSRQPPVQLFRRRILLCTGQLFDDREPLLRHAKRTAGERRTDRALRRLFSHRARAVERRDASTAESSERRRGENNIARKKQAVAVRTIVAPDAASR